MNVEFARPEVLYLLLLLPLWWVLVWPRSGWGVLFARGRAARPADGRRDLRSRVVLVLPRLLRSAALVAVVVALAGPERIEAVEEREPRGGAIGLALDLSSSMLAEDLEGDVSRMEAARSAAVRFAAGRRHDELSVVAFAGEALTRVPPTTDRGLVRSGIESLDVHLLQDGSDIATGLLTTVDGLLEAEGESRVVVLLSDGAHNGYRVPLMTAARAADAMDVRVHAISIPGPSDAPGGRDRSPDRGSNGATQRALAGVADVTGGRYFQASSARALDSVYREIDRLEAPVEEITEREARHPLDASLLLFGLLLLGSEVLLRGSRRGVVP